MTFPVSSTICGIVGVRKSAKLYLPVKDGNISGGKWSSAYNEGGVRGASERFFAELSLSNQDLLVKRAIELYDRKSRIKL